MDTDQIKRALDRTRADFAKVPTSEHTRLLQAIIAENDVVLGVFNDNEDPRGWSHVIIKGEQALSESVRTKTTVDLKTAAIPAKRPMKRWRSDRPSPPAARIERGGRLVSLRNSRRSVQGGQAGGPRIYYCEYFLRTSAASNASFAPGSPAWNMTTVTPTSAVRR